MTSFKIKLRVLEALSNGLKLPLAEHFFFKLNILQSCFVVAFSKAKQYAQKNASYTPLSSAMLQKECNYVQESPPFCELR